MNLGVPNGDLRAWGNDMVVFLFVQERVVLVGKELAE